MSFNSVPDSSTHFVVYCLNTCVTFPSSSVLLSTKEYLSISPAGLVVVSVTGVFSSFPLISTHLVSTCLIATPWYAIVFAIIPTCGKLTTGGSTGSATNGVGVGCTGLSGKVKSTFPSFGMLITLYPPHLLSFVSKDTFKLFPANRVSPSP